MVSIMDKLNPDDFEKIKAKSFLTLIDDFPLPASIQKLDRTLVFQNKLAKKFFASNKYPKHCFTRWDFVSKDEEIPCFACPLLEMVKSNTPKTIIRQTKDSSGATLFLEVSHYPLVDKDTNETTYFVEVVRDVTEFVLSGLLEKGKRLIESEEARAYFLSILSFVKPANLLVSETLPFYSSSIEKNEFFSNISAVSYYAVGHTQKWVPGLYGPLPIKNQDDYYLILYAFAKKTKQPITDTRLKKDLLILSVFSRKEMLPFWTFRETLSTLFESFFANIEYRENITSDTLAELRKQINRLMRSELRVLLNLK